MKRTLWTKFALALGGFRMVSKKWTDQCEDCSLKKKRHCYSRAFFLKRKTRRLKREKKELTVSVVDGGGCCFSSRRCFNVRPHIGESLRFLFQLLLLAPGGSVGGLCFHDVIIVLQVHATTIQLLFPVLGWRGAAFGGCKLLLWLLLLGQKLIASPPPPSSSSPGTPAAARSRYAISYNL